MGVSAPWFDYPPARLGLECDDQSVDTGRMTAQIPKGLPDARRGSELPPIPTYADVQRHPKALETFNDHVVDQFRANGGIVGGPFLGSNVLLLTMTGARSGRRRVTPLEYFTVDSRLLLIGSFGGALKNPAWVHNLRVNADVHVEIGEQAYDAIAHELPSDEAEVLFAEIAARHPRIAGYPHPDRRIPLFVLHKA